MGVFHGRSRGQKGKKRKYEAGKHSKGFKKRKEEVKQALKSLGKQVQHLDNVIGNQEKLSDKILLWMTVHLFLPLRLLAFLSTDDFKIRIYHARV
ncbi:hypothetical protein OIU84_003839 [Salix udensis]|uniref:Uncharacterized protein n=1 Tax=Salix udensis TaxID=889485 RepID=A0AAD6K2Q2_9ROSI|nr:hypothetical protein OIU84_003839 [Salix udensis]